jgi:hypothetical protein
MTPAKLPLIFSHTTTPYKYFFFLALIETIKYNDDEREIELNELATRAVLLAWYPRKLYKLSFGLGDSLGSLIDSIETNEISSPNTSSHQKAEIKRLIEKKFEELRIDEKFLRYVPFRLLSPFFSSELRGVPDKDKNKIITALADTSFGSVDPPFYRFATDKKIQPHSSWASYIRSNYLLIKGWAEKELIAYLEKNNLNTPAISRKISQTTARNSLAKQTELWKRFILNNECRCIYSGSVLKPEGFSLDHFAPWSYVCHDELWNLIPTTKAINSSKSNSTPDHSYISSFVQLNLDFIRFCSNEIEDWRKQLDSYVKFLRFSHDELTSDDPEKRRVIEAEYHKTIESILSLAEQDGFISGWRHSNR